ncbi:(2Fe-2S)-binding protein [Roseococcus sp. YIM B11640]|uniref:(2Fe-2S)-binding protein n=1 Tax=Roseococcus sp. YIM B11640 TaxID=3133973 RepID=UPI003C7C935C
MFRRTGPTDCTIRWNEQEIPARAGEPLAAALLAAGVAGFRQTAVTGAGRGPFCLMGACFDCLVELDGVPNKQACMVSVTPGISARSQDGARIAGE